MDATTEAKELKTAGEKQTLKDVAVTFTIALVATVILAVWAMPEATVWAWLFTGFVIWAVLHGVFVKSRASRAQKD